MVTRFFRPLGKDTAFFYLRGGIKMEYIVYFILTFLIVYAISYFLLVRKKDKYDASKVPVEVEYMIKKYRLDVGKMDYKKFLNAISLLGSLDMSIAVIFIFPIENIFLQLLVGFLILIPLILISFHFLGKYYVKKGFVKDERKRKRNRK